MADVKAEAMGLDDWHELLDPLGWWDIRPRSYGIEIRVAVQPGDGYDGHDEWAERAAMLGRVQQLVDAIQARGFTLINAPVIQFGGEYRYQLPAWIPEWVAEASVEFVAVEAAR